MSKPQRCASANERARHGQAVDWAGRKRPRRWMRRLQRWGRKHRHRRQVEQPLIRVVDLTPRRLSTPSAYVPMVYLFGPHPTATVSYKSKLTPHQLGVGNLQALAAQRACRSSIPTYSATRGSSQVVTAALKFSRCMRAHGSTNFPDPKANGAIVIPHAMENSPVYLAALHTCIRKYGVPPPP